jgi:hypothetical protein
LSPNAPGAARRFLAGWYGAPVQGRSGGESLDALPGPLRELHRLASEWPQAISHNRLLAPSEMERKDGRRVFAREDQDVVRWAYEEGDRDDPCVWAWWGEPLGWTRESPSISQFAVEFLIQDASANAWCGVIADADNRETCERLLAPLSSLPLGPWSDGLGGEQTFYAGERLLATKSNVLAVFARNDDDLAYAIEIDDPLGTLEWWGTDGDGFMWAGLRTEQPT